MKKLLAFVLATTMLGLVACSPKAPVDNKNMKDSKTTEAPKKVALRVWGPQEEQELLLKMTEEFKKAHPEKEWDISFGVVGEPDALKKYTEDPSSAADVFAFPNDQINDLVKAGALYKVTRNVDEIKKRNAPESVEGSSVGGQLYGYPMTADNGYFMYYDKSVFSKDDVKSLEKMLEVAQAKNKKIFMDVSNGWYIASFFLGAGCTFDIKDGKQVIDFNSEKGLVAAEAIKKFTAHKAFLTGDDSIFVSGIGDTIAAGVSGAWNATEVAKKLGDNYAAAKLPTFKDGQGKDIQMGSFVGYKVLGVNSQTKHPVEAMELADWLSNEANQRTRFKVRRLLPSNIEAGKDPEIAKDVALVALAEQSQFGTSQKNVTGKYWGPAEAFGAVLEAKDYSKDLATLLNEMVKQIQE